MEARRHGNQHKVQQKGKQQIGGTKTLHRAGHSERQHISNGFETNAYKV
jgi:hypothetical protein